MGGGAKFRHRTQRPAAARLALKQVPAVAPLVTYGGPVGCGGNVTSTDSMTLLNETLPKIGWPMVGIGQGSGSDESESDN